jgi:hypothetical protein
MAAVHAWDGKSTELLGAHMPLLFQVPQNSSSAPAPLESDHLKYWHPHIEDTVKQKNCLDYTITASLITQL